jgi:hypothetical protein
MINDDDVELSKEAHSPTLRAILDAADRRIDEGQGIEHEEFWKQVEADRNRTCNKQPPNQR